MRDLLARRVAPEVARKALETAYSAADEIVMIGQFLERKFRGKDLTTLLREEKYLASAYRRLRTAGFSSANSIQALKRYAARADDLESIEDEHAE
jgi:regulatory protein